MSTKVYFVGTEPGETTGTNGTATGGHTPATIDQTVKNLQMAVDRGVRADGATPFTGNVGIGKTPNQRLHLYNDGSSLYCKIERSSGSLLAGMDSTGGAILTDTATPLYFGTSGTERARIDTSGNMLVGVTSGAYHTYAKTNNSDFAFSITNNGSTNPFGLYIGLNTTNSAGSFIQASDSGAMRFRVLGNGNVQNVNNSYGAISDIKLKENIAPASSCWNTFKQYRFVNYNLISDPSQTKLLGLIAQEVELISPSIVEETPDTMEVDGKQEPTGEVTKAVKYSIVTLQAEVVLQEAQARIEQLEATLENVLVRLAALEA